MGKIGFSSINSSNSSITISGVPISSKLSIIFSLISKPGSWNRATVRDILLNPFYAGVRVWNRFDQVHDSSEWIFAENSHDRIIDDQIFIVASNKDQKTNMK